MINHSYFSGKKNIDSMGIDYLSNGDKIEGIFVPKSTHVSYSNVVHGGLISALLDDAMAFAINLKTVIAYTGRLEIRFKKPLEVGQTYYIRACIDDFKKKYIKTSGVIADKENKLYATAKALFIVAQV